MCYKLIEDKIPVSLALTWQVMFCKLLQALWPITSRYFFKYTNYFI